MATKFTIAHFAYTFAESAHEGQFRKDGTPYFSHPKRVADLVRHYKGESSEIEQLCAAAYLHDTLEDTEVTYYDLVEAFGHPVAALVLELTSNPDMKNGVGDKAKYLGYKLKNMTHWALVIKLCDRFDNITDMSGCSFEWKKRYLNETDFIITYLMSNRMLTPTHVRIINDLSLIVQRALRQINQ